jgi:hypothetical protein
MKNEAKAANGGALSVDQAVARLGEPKKKNVADADETAPAEDETATPEIEDAGGQAQGEEDDGEADSALRQVQDEDDGEDAELAPPKFWDAKAKERFGELPRDLQEIVLDKEAERNQATAKALQETAERRKTAEVARRRGSRPWPTGWTGFCPRPMTVSPTAGPRWTGARWPSSTARSRR